MAAAPLILTLAFDPAAFERFDRLRRLHFPSDRNFIPAHLTLFHHLPGEEEAGIVGVLAEAARLQPSLSLSVTGLRFMGRGVAYTLASPELARLRNQLAEAWHGWLTPQDRQRFQPHVTVQNKVDPQEARELHEGLSATFSPFTVTGEGLDLWRYRGGPWEAAGSFRFGAG